MVDYVLLLLLQPGLTNVESLNLDSCRIDDEGLVNLAGHFYSITICLFGSSCPCFSYSGSYVSLKVSKMLHVLLEHVSCILFNFHC